MTNGGAPLRVLVWQWGRRGAGPRFAAALAEGIALLPGTQAMLALSNRAEILTGPRPPLCTFQVPTYTNLYNLAWRLLLSPFVVAGLVRQLRRLELDLAICAMPSPLDLLLLSALRLTGVPAVVIAHDAEAHPGDGFPFQMALQTQLLRRADCVVALTEHVAAKLREQRLVTHRQPLILASHPPFLFGPPPPPPRSHGGKCRLLFFGRLLSYKGLGLLAEALQRLGPRADLDVRVIGSGPESPALSRLRSLTGVSVENRWVPEREIGDLIGWSDILILPYTEASQSGVAAAAIAAGRWIIATRVGGLVEQLKDQPLATFCDPDVNSLALAIRTKLEMQPPLPSCGADDTQEAWRRMAASLLSDIELALFSPARPRSAVPSLM